MWITRCESNILFQLGVHQRAAMYVQNYAELCYCSLTNKKAKTVLCSVIKPARK